MEMEANDLDLLRQFARNRSQDAFAEIVRRHLGLVYSAALRQVRSPHLAEDIAQSVFADLARAASRLKADTILSAWLYAVTRRTAVDAIRKESRRRTREEIAAQLHAVNAIDDSWRHIEPVLDEAMAALDEGDRAAVLLRFFENKSLREVGARLGVSDDAAQKRVSRAIEKLREFFAKRQVTIGASGLALVLAANAVQSAPAALAATIGAVALTGTGVSATAILASTKTIAMTTLQKTLLTAAVLAAAGFGIYEARQASNARAESASLRAQVDRLAAEKEGLAARLVATPHLPAPPIQAVVTTATNVPPDDFETTNFWAKFKERPAKITPEQAEAFLKANGRNAANLLASYRTSGEPALLEEAMRKFPNDPQVAFEAAEATALHQLNLTPDEQRQWLDAFEKSAPNNSLANYLSAIHYFNAGQIDEGIKELTAASGKALDDYTVSRAENDIEAYLAAGYSMAEAEQMGTSQLLLPQLAELKQFTRQIYDLAGAYRQNGDPASAQTVLLMGDALGQQYANPAPGEPTISQLVGIVIENMTLKTLDPNTPYGDSGQTVRDRLAQLQQQRDSLQQLDQQVETLLPAITAQDLILYKNRWLMFGEQNAQQWLVGKYGGQ